MDRQKKEDAKEQTMLKKLHQQFESYKDQVKKMGEETKPALDQKSEAPTCGICHKTKFADGCGHLCSYCQTKFCARCGGRVSLRSNKSPVSLDQRGPSEASGGQPAHRVWFPGGSLVSLLCELELSTVLKVGALRVSTF
ncbi:unnamed protein product [Arctogadus glacialis]